MTETIKTGDLIIDISGGIVVNVQVVSNTCQHKNVGFNFPHDASYCKDCREWLESKCNDPGCSACSDRPAIAPLDDGCPRDIAGGLRKRMIAPWAPELPQVERRT